MIYSLYWYFKLLLSFLLYFVIFCIITDLYELIIHIYNNISKNNTHHIRTCNKKTYSLL